jgi:hypothetical protein
MHLFETKKINIALIDHLTVWLKALVLRAGWFIA